MKCEEILERLEEAPSPRLEDLPGEMRVHLARCPACHRLWQAFSHPAAEPPAPSWETVARICGEMSRTLHPVRPIPSPSVRATGFLAIFGVTAAVCATAIGWRGAAVMNGLQLGGLLLAAVAAAALTAIAASAEVAPGEKRIVSPSGLAVGLVGLLLVLAAALFPWEFPHGSSSGNWHCLEAGFFFSLPPGALAIALAWRARPFAWGAVGALAGLLAGLAGLAVLHIGCPVQNAPHVALSHVGTPALASALGFGLGKLLPPLLRRLRVDAP